MKRAAAFSAAVVGIALLLGVQAARGEDWPQWRGPNRDGVSKETGLLQQWPADGPKLAWQIRDAGQGYSTPSVVGDRLYLLGNSGLADEFVQCRSATDGKLLWSTRIGKVGNPDQRPAYPAARSTPTVDGEVLYALGSDGDLACLETAGGKERWRKNLRTDFGGAPGVWAYSESPLLDGEGVICTPGGAKATVVKLDKKTGETLWTCAIPGGDAAGYASPIIVEAAGARQIVQFMQNGLVGIDVKTGKFLWRYAHTAKGSPANIPTPVARDGLIYSAGARSGGGLVKLKAEGEGIAAEELYFSPKLPAAIGGSVLIGDYLYGAGGQVLYCIAFKTGDVKWTDRSIAPGAVCYADNRIYLHGENGKAALIEATPEGYRERGQFTPPDAPDLGGSKAWAYPVVANGRLYLRQGQSVWCYEIAGEEAAK